MADKEEHKKADQTEEDRTVHKNSVDAIAPLSHAHRDGAKGQKEKACKGGPVEFAIRTSVIARASTSSGRVAICAG